VSIKTPVRHGSFDQLVLFDNDGKYLCKISDCSEETAAKIVTALNSLPALVEALRAARSGLYDALHAGDDDDARLSVAYAKSILNKINEALKGIPQ
jgi:hypothetical protein